MDCKINTINDGNNPSQHQPICVKPKLSARILPTYETGNFATLDWERATPEHLSHYRLLIDYYLRNAIIPDCLTCADVLCNKHDDQIMLFMEHVLDVVYECVELAIPRRRNSGRRGIPGWNESVQLYKEKCLFWHDVWKSAGCPAQGQLADLRRHTRRKYHWAIKQVKKNKDRTIKEQTAITLTNKSFKDFWAIIKRMNKSTNTFSGIVDGYCNDQNIANRFRSLYKDLYNSVPLNNINETSCHVNQLIKDTCKVGKCSSSSCHVIEVNVVKKCY